MFPTAPSERLRSFVLAQSDTVEPNGLWYLLTEFFESRDVPLVSYHHYPPIGTHDHTVSIRTEGFPDDWVCRYVGDELIKVDPIPGFALRSVRPFFWSEVGQLGNLVAEQQAFMGELASSGVGDGIAVQVFGPGLRNGYFGLGFGGRKRPISSEEIGEWQMVCQMAHLRFCDLMPPTPVLDFGLSPREREVLEWIARGKSNSVIGDILELSTHTVDAYLRRIFTKLEVSDRTTAAIKGVGSGLIRGEV